MTEAESHLPEPFCPPERRRDVLVAAILASSLGFIDGSVVAIAAPAMRADLGASLTAMQWVSSAYLLLLASLVMTGGAMGDRYGLRNVFGAGIAGFVAASAACAAAPDAGFLVAARAVQGLAAAAMVPGSLAIIAKAYPPEGRSGAIGAWAAASASMAAAGPILVGLLLSALGDWGWRAIFALNLPLGAVCLFLLARVPADRPDPGRSLDVAGALLATAALGTLAFGLTGGAAALLKAGDSASPADWPTTFAGVALLGLFVWRQARATHPMMPLGLFAAGSFAGANLATLLLYFALSACLFFLPMTLVSAWRIGEAQAALVFLPISLIVGVMSGPVGRMAGRTGARPWMVWGSVGCAIGYGLLAATMASMAFWSMLMPAMVIAGVGMGLLVSPLSAAVMTEVPEKSTGVASAVNNTVARMAGLLAVASLGGVVSWAFAQAGPPPGMAFGELPEGAAPAAQVAFAAASNSAFAAVAWICAGLSLAAAAVSQAMLPKGR